MTTTTCGPELVAAALDLLRAARPGESPRLDAGVVMLWSDALSRCEGELVLRCAREIAATGETFPPLSVFLAAVQGAQRRQALAEAPVNEPPSDLGHMVLREAMAYAASVPEHNHRRGLDRCPACSTSAARVADFRTHMEQVASGVWTRPIPLAVVRADPYSDEALFADPDDELWG